MGGRERGRKDVQIAVKDIDVARGIIVGVPSVAGVVDDGDDRVTLGSFAKTLNDHAASMSRIKLGYQHDLEYPFGVSMAGQEIGRDALPADIQARYPEATGGLEMIGKVQPMSDRNRERLEQVSVGNVTGSSFAYDVIDAAYSTDEKTGRPVRDLKELRLHEWGPVTIGMNPAAAITDVKARDGLKALDGSFEALRDQINDAILSADLFPQAESVWVRDTFADRVVVCAYTDGEPAREFEVRYGTDSGGEIVLGAIAEVERVETIEPKAIAFAAIIASAARDIKAGRVLSANNLGRLQAAIDALTEILAAAQPGEGTEKRGETTAPAAPATEALRELDSRMAAFDFDLAKTRAALAAVGS